jgi:methyl-accepting chemotaxis protein
MKFYRIFELNVKKTATNIAEISEKTASGTELLASVSQEAAHEIDSISQAIKRLNLLMKEMSSSIEKFKI